MSCSLITRADDAGSSHAANQAIAEAVQAGFIRNVSVMAVGPAVEEAAAMLQDVKSVCIGMHATINSEWDRVKWRPASSPESIPSLLDHTGNFFQRSAFFPPEISPQELLHELNAQLNHLQRLGLNPVYVDSHMYFERRYPQLQSAFSQWAKEHNLIDHRYFCRSFPLPREEHSLAAKIQAAARRAGTGQYLLVFHPACPTNEMLQFDFDGMPAQCVQAGRGEAYRFLTDGTAQSLCHQYQVTPISYSEAIPNIFA